MIKKIMHGKENKDGKTFWTQCGIVLIKDGGKMSLKLDYLPVDMGDGWLQIFDIEKRDDDNSTGKDLPY